MREIKFRGKFKDGEWEYGGIRFGDMGQAYILPHGANSIVELVDRHTVGQYTGLKDKNGKEIYEGDIVEYKIRYFTGSGNIQEFKRINTVEWDEKEFEFKGIRTSYKEIFEVKAEIIGNIHENPELLEDKNG